MVVSIIMAAWRWAVKSGAGLVTVERDRENIPALTIAIFA